MCRAIADAHSVDEVKDIRDRALAIEIYSRQARNIENEKRAIEIRIRAERRCGELLAEMEKAKGGWPSETRGTTPVLQDLGISNNQSSRWQKLAAVPQEDFEATFAGAEKPSTNGIITAHSPKKNAVPDEALWLWGRLLDFERNGLLDEDPNDIVASMLDHMKDAVRELAPKVSVWLKEIEK
jgi:hypothetical protein